MTTTVIASREVVTVDPSDPISPVRSHDVVSSSRYLSLIVTPGATFKKSSAVRNATRRNSTLAVKRIAADISHRLGMGINPAYSGHEIFVKRLDGREYGDYRVSIEEQYLGGLITELDLSDNPFMGPRRRTARARVTLVEYGLHLSLLVNAGSPAQDCRHAVQAWADQSFHWRRRRGHSDTQVTHRHGTSQYRVQVAHSASEIPS